MGVCTSASALSPHGSIPVVLYCILCAPWNGLCNFCPVVSQADVGLHKHLLLLLSPGIPADVRPELVVPSVSALLPNPALGLPCYGTPVTFSKLGHQTAGKRIFTLLSLLLLSIYAS